MTPNDRRKRAIRTRFQAFVAACTVLLVVVPTVMEALEGSVPDRLYPYLVSAAAAIVGVAGLVTRVMSLPTVTAFIDKYVPWLSAEGK